MSVELIFLIGAAVVGIIILANVVRVVPQNEALIVERLGKYSSTLEAGFHILIPFIDKVTYRHSLKEFAISNESEIKVLNNLISKSSEQTKMINQARDNLKNLDNNTSLRNITKEEINSLLKERQETIVQINKFAKDNLGVDELLENLKLID